MQGRFDEAVRLAEEAFTAELAKLLSHLAERLSGQDNGKPKIFRDSARREPDRVLPAVPPIECPQQRSAGSLVARPNRSSAVSSPGLRDNAGLRQHVATEMSRVQSVLDGLLVDRPRRNILRRPRVTGTAMQLVIEPGGVVRCIYGEDIDLAALGSPAISRATHVEPDQQGRWLADLSPVVGHVWDRSVPGARPWRPSTLGWRPTGSAAGAADSRSPFSCFPPFMETLLMIVTPESFPLDQWRQRLGGRRHFMLSPGPWPRWVTLPMGRSPKVCIEIEKLTIVLLYDEATSKDRLTHRLVGYSASRVRLGCPFRRPRAVQVLQGPLAPASSRGSRVSARPGQCRTAVSGPRLERELDRYPRYRQRDDCAIRSDCRNSGPDFASRCSEHHRRRPGTGRLCGIYWARSPHTAPAGPPPPRSIRLGFLSVGLDQPPLAASRNGVRRS